MACSVCRRNCPIVKEEKKEQQQQLITILQTIPLILSNPLVIAGAWLGISRMFPSVNLLNNLIATAEIVPTVDLNVPQGVVLGAMIDKTDDAINLFNDITDNPIPTREEVKEGTVELGKDVGQFILDFFTPTSDLWQGKK